MVAWTCIINHRFFYVCKVIRLHTFCHGLIIPCIPSGIPTTHLFLDSTCFRLLLVSVIAKQVELSICCVVKGYRECSFKTNVGGTFYLAFKKRGECGKVANLTGGSPAAFKSWIKILGPLWPLHKKDNYVSLRKIRVSETFVNSYGAFHWLLLI